MKIGADMVSGLGVVLSVIGGLYWIWFGSAFQSNRLAAIRSRSPWHLLGNLTIAGMLIFVIGRVMAGAR
jgi:hypothetical protein